MTDATTKKSPAEVADELIDRFIREERLSVGEVAEIFAEGSALVLEMARERLRLIEAETGQLQIVLGQGPPQRRSNRAAEDESLLTFLQKQTGPMTQQDIATMTKLGARTAPTLQRLQRRDLVRTEGRGPASKWWWNPVPLSSATDETAKPRARKFDLVDQSNGTVIAPTPLRHPSALLRATTDERQILLDEVQKQAADKKKRHPTPEGA